jgi:hypothetical protein
MNNKIYNTISDPQQDSDIIKWYEVGSLNQRLLYTDKWAQEYYNWKDQFYDSDEILNINDFINFWKEHCFHKNKKTLAISIWCGNSWTEKEIITTLSKDNYDISYLWVDSSQKMLELSQENFKDIDINQYFMRSDFWSPFFLSEIEKYSKQYEDVIFIFFWWTFGNIKHTKIVNILNNLLNAWEKLWTDIYIRKGLTLQDDIVIHENYKKYLTNKKKTLFLTDRLSSDGVNIQKWELTLETKKITEINALIFTFSFIFHEKDDIKIRHDKVTFLPNTKIELLKIYRFDPEAFINFIIEYNFLLINKQIKWHRGQFLFEQK